MQQDVDVELRSPMYAAGVGATDLSMLEGNYLFAPKTPFVPGYELEGRLNG